MTTVKFQGVFYGRVSTEDRQELVIAEKEARKGNVTPACPDRRRTVPCQIRCILRRGHPDALRRATP